MDSKKTTSPCGYHDDGLDSADRNGEHVMLQGTAVDRQPDGTYKSAGLLTLLSKLNDSEKLGGLLLSTPQGAFLISAAYTDMNYSPAVLQKLGLRPSHP